MSQRIGSRWLTALGVALALSACHDAPTAAPAATASASAVKFWNVGSSVAWNTTARELLPGSVHATPTGQPRAFAYLSVAQYNAVVAAEEANGNGARASVAAAAAGASWEVLKSLFPASVTLLNDRLAAQKAAERWAGARQDDWAAGEAIGRSVGLAVVAYAATDADDKLPAPPNPGGVGNWTGTNPVLGFYGWRTFALTSDDQFRPGPPPEFGSEAFLDAFEEVRAMNAEITAGLAPDHLQIARDWAARGGAYMNGIAAAMIVDHHRTEIEAARILALANMAAFDVLDACFDAKLAYYYIRPVQYAATIVPALDPVFTLHVGMPNHPSYPSGHSCVTGAYATVLKDAFPDQAAYLQGRVEEAGLARMYGGLHYRFDCEAGRELGRNVAEWVMKTAPSGHAAIPLD